MDSKTDFVTFLPTTNYILPSGNTSTEICNLSAPDDSKSITDLFSDPNCLRHAFNWTLFFIILYAILFVFGLMVNGLVAGLLALKREMHTTQNLFIANLIVADLFVIGFCLPPTLLSNIFIPWISGRNMCKAVSYIQGVSRLSSAFTLIAVSLDRYRTMYYPTNHPDSLSKYSVLKILVCIWTLAAFLALPYLFVFELVYLLETGAMPYCQEIWTNLNFGKLYYVVVHLGFSFLVPLRVVTTGNTAIWKTFFGQNLPNLSTDEEEEEEAQAEPLLEESERVKNRRFVKLLTALIVTFLLCWLPFHVLTLKSKFLKYSDHNLWEIIAIHIAQLLVVLNSCLNPVIYAYLDTTFVQILGSICKRSDHTSFGGGGEEQQYVRRRRVYEDEDDEINSENCNLIQLGLQTNPHHHQDTSTSSSEEGKSCLVLGVTTAQVHPQPETSSDSEEAYQSTDV